MLQRKPARRKVLRQLPPPYEARGRPEDPRRQAEMPVHHGHPERNAYKFLIPVWPDSPNKIRTGSLRAILGRAGAIRRMREAAFLTLCQIDPETRGRVGRGYLDCEVTLLRVSPRLLDMDNWIAACKSVRDGIADAFDLSDNAPHLRFRYDQAIQSKTKEVWARISIVPTPPGYAMLWARKKAGKKLNRYK